MVLLAAIKLTCADGNESKIVPFFPIVAPIFPSNCFYSKRYENNADKCKFLHLLRLDYEFEWFAHSVSLQKNSTFPFRKNWIRMERKRTGWSLVQTCCKRWTIRSAAVSVIFQANACVLLLYIVFPRKWSALVTEINSAMKKENEKQIYRNRNRNINISESTRQTGLNCLVFGYMTEYFLSLIVWEFWVLYNTHWIDVMWLWWVWRAIA